MFNIKQEPFDGVTPHHMPSAKSIESLDDMNSKTGACSFVEGNTHKNTFTYGMNNRTRPADVALYESLTYEDRLIFDQYDLMCNYAETRNNVDINIVEGKLQEQYELALKAKKSNEMESSQTEEMSQEKC